MTIIADPEVDPKFGTGIMKVTPAHDMHDFELGKRYNLPVTPIIGFNGRMDFSWFLEKKNIDSKYRERAEKYHGKKVAQARALMVEDLQADGLLVKTDEKYTHRIGVCYKCGTVIEPLPLTQWYIKVQPLATRAIDTIKKGKIQFVPTRFKKHALSWLTNFHDWNISRQIVWGIRIPAWHCALCDKWTVTDGSVPTACSACGSTKIEQDTDTFDTWFSSGQWPFATLQSAKPGDFDHFYPTSVMETGYDILPWWVCRMIMLGLYATDNIPFQTVYLHGLVRDAKGQKMSKSKGNVINPLEMVDKYGADALRIALIFGTTAGNDMSLSEEKIRGMRNFANKVWNIARFILIEFTTVNDVSTIPKFSQKLPKMTAADKKTIKALNQLIHISTKGLDSYRLSDVAQSIYDFTWHSFADIYIEEAKIQIQKAKEAGDTKSIASTLSILRHTFATTITLLHPFMPFLTEELWGKIPGVKEKPLIISSWPKKL